jgi:hypothetical protein
VILPPFSVPWLLDYESCLIPLPTHPKKYSRIFKALIKGWKGLPGTNALAYLCPSSVTSKESLKTSAPDAKLPAAARERANGGVHRRQVLLGQVQDEAALPPLALPSGVEAYNPLFS